MKAYSAFFRLKLNCNLKIHLCFFFAASHNFQACYVPGAQHQNNKCCVSVGFFIEYVLVITCILIQINNSIVVVLIKIFDFIGITCFLMCIIIYFKEIKYTVKIATYQCTNSVLCFGYNHFYLILYSINTSFSYSCLQLQ